VLDLLVVGQNVVGRLDGHVLKRSALWNLRKVTELTVLAILYAETETFGSCGLVDENLGSGWILRKPFSFSVAETPPALPGSLLHLPFRAKPWERRLVGQ